MKFFYYKKSIVFWMIVSNPDTSQYDEYDLR